MNSLNDLRTLFRSVGKAVEGYTGYEFKSGADTWGVAFENPVFNGQEIAPIDWRAYVKALKEAKASGHSVEFAPTITVVKEQPVYIMPKLTPMIPAAASEPKPKQVIRKQPPAITCPHCGKSGGVIGMKRWHFDKCAAKGKK